MLCDLITCFVSSPNRTGLTLLSTVKSDIRVLLQSSAEVNRYITCLLLSFNSPILVYVLYVYTVLRVHRICCYWVAFACENCLRYFLILFCTVLIRR